jgi:hypothetical protein
MYHLRVMPRSALLHTVAVMTVQLMKEAWSMSSTTSIGRFSTGMEQTGPSPEKGRIGRFSTGMEQTGPSPEKGRIGRFSTGMEKDRGAGSEARGTLGAAQKRSHDRAPAKRPA